MVSDIDGNEIRKGDRVRVVACARTEVEWNSNIVRKVVGLGEGTVFLEWDGTPSVPWPADSCRLV